MGGKKRSTHSKRRRKKTPRLRHQRAIKTGTLAAEKRSNPNWSRVKLVVSVVSILLLSGSLLYVYWPFIVSNESLQITEQNNESDITELRAAILDGLHNTRPNVAFTETLTRTLEEARFNVSLYQGKSVTINLLKDVKDYDLLILRLHSGIHTDRWLYIFSGEPYIESKYVADQLSGAVRKAYTFDEDEAPFFALNSAYLGINSPNSLEDTTIILMGCNATDDLYSIQRLIERGAKAYLAWNGYVDLSYTDAATIRLIEAIYSQGSSLDKAVDIIVEEIGPDPTYGSSLEYFT
ncbi:MAG: hypothetical protein JSV58_03475 [Candidatus Bathyarchaeota archaeon]|nr:MAG: hypothetical protein JSV58_03475 [Candidatus Bathyarchaeota archaeon]